MELSVLLLLTVLTGLLLLIGRGQPKSRGRLPPGPRPLPFFGNLLQMDRNGLLKSILKMRDQYGDVFTLYLGPKPVVILCGTEAIREALVDQTDAFSGRGKIAVLEPVFQDYCLVFSNGERWKVLRQFALTTMRDFGMGKRSVEERIQEEAQYLVEKLRNTKGTLQDPKFFFQARVANVICSIVFGERFSYQDPEFRRLLHLIFSSFVLMSSFSAQMFELFSGFLKYFPGAHSQVSRNLKEVNDFIARNVEKHRETLDSTAPRDFIDAYLIRMDKEKSNPNTEFHHMNLIISVLSLLTGNTETTSTTLCYGFLLMLKYPQRVQKEIDQVIGSHRAPDLNDRINMPYTDAVIHEIQRYADVIPMGIPRSVTKDTHFRGNIIPEGTQVFPILSSALNDTHYFGKPETFNPDHFLDANRALKKSDAFIPFSVGKRICPGEGIARAQIFLVFTTTLQNFNLATSMAPEDIDLTPMECGVGKLPPPYKICFLPHHGD